MWVAFTFFHILKMQVLVVSVTTVSFSFTSISGSVNPTKLPEFEMYKYFSSAVMSYILTTD